MIHILEHCVTDTLMVLPLLFLSYILVEYIVHRMSSRTREMIFRAGKAGPIIGALVGMIPQCGFSAAAAGLFAGGVISPGTLLAVFLSTSDEMLPILLSERTPVPVILKILLIKGTVAALAGIFTDLAAAAFGRNKRMEHGHSPLCEHGHCHCEDGGIFRPALYHTLQVTVFLFLINLVLGFGMERLEESQAMQFITGTVFLQEALCALVGLVPNCAASVLITQLYLGGVIHAGALFAGLLCGAGSGLLVLFRTNRNMKQNLLLLVLLYGIGLAAGFLIGQTGIM